MRYLLCAAMLLASAPLALAQTTNTASAAQRARAEGLAKGAGFTGLAFVDAQGGAVFFWAMKDSKRVYLTVTADGKVYAGGVAIEDPKPNVPYATFPP